MASFNAHETPFSGLIIIDLKRHPDHRGFFVETFKRSVFKELSIPYEIVQENHSASHRGVLRGLHYQLQPYAQGKLIYCAQGHIFDVVVDLRRKQSTFGKHFTIELSEDNAQMLWVPPGFAHGFYTLSEKAYVTYKIVGSEYHGPSERSLRWNDPHLGIKWPLSAPPTLSSKDAQAPYFAEAEYNFDDL